MVPPRPLHVPLRTDGWASDEQALGIDRTSLGHTLPTQRATSAQTGSPLLGTILSFSNKLSKKHHEDYNRTQRQ